MADGSSQEDEVTITGSTQDVYTRWTAIEELDTELASSWRQVTSDELSRFRLWSNNLGATHKENDPRSADHRLHAVPDVRRRILQLLDELSESLDEIHAIQSGARQGEEEDPGDTDTLFDDRSNTSLRSEISELWLMVGDVITNLLKVTVLVRKSTMRNRFDHAVKAAIKANASSTPITWDIEHVRHKFPKLEEKQWLIQRLGEISAHRRTFLMYAQDHERRLGSSKDELDGNKSIASKPTEASTRATTLAPAKINSSILQRLEDYDGDDALSTTSATTYNTVAGNDNDADTLSVVPLSSVFLQGKPGICPYCRGMVHFKREKAWRRHVFSDLMAYSCTFEHCDHGPFGSRTSWAAHERLSHLRIWTCPVCQKLFDSQALVMKHVDTDHPSVDKTLSRELTYAESPEIERVSISQCVFCDDHHLWNRLLEPRSTSISKNEPPIDHSLRDAMVPVALYQRHMSRHMEQLALFAVPSVADDDNNDGNTSDQSTQISSDQVVVAPSPLATTESPPTDYKSSPEEAVDARKNELVSSTTVQDHDARDVGKEPREDAETSLSKTQPSGISEQLSDASISVHMQDSLGQTPILLTQPSINLHSDSGLLHSTPKSASHSSSGGSSIGGLATGSEDEWVKDRPADVPTSDRDQPPSPLKNRSHSATSLPDELQAAKEQEPITQPQPTTGGRSRSGESSASAQADSLTTSESTSVRANPYSTAALYSGDGAETAPSFPTTLPSSPSVRRSNSGTALYNLPPSLNMPRASNNERPSRRVDFETGMTGQTSRRRRVSFSKTTESRRSTDDSSTERSPGLSHLPSLRYDREYSARESAREAARRHEALDEEILRRQEEIEAAENLQLDREAERAQYRRSFDPLGRFPDLNPSDHDELDTRSNATHHSAPLHLRRYRYPTGPEDTLGPRIEATERGRERGAADGQAVTVGEDMRATRQRREPILDIFEEVPARLECYYDSGGPLRRETRRRSRDDLQRRRDRRDEFFR